jgi:hypothetical protein
MPCTYVSETVVNIKSLKILTKALDVMGHKYEVHQKGNAAVITSQSFKIEMNEKGASVDRADGNRTWINSLKQRYAAEAAKITAKRKGYFVKETIVGNQIELSVRK